MIHSAYSTSAHLIHVVINLSICIDTLGINYEKYGFFADLHQPYITIKCSNTSQDSCKK